MKERNNMEIQKLPVYPVLTCGLNESAKEIAKKLKEKKVKVKKATKKEIKKKEGVKPTKQRRLRLKKILKLRAKMKGLRTKKKANKKK